jgi:tRNA (guanine37-N1)-methyltransferase
VNDGLGSERFAIEVVTLFPDFVAGAVRVGVVGRAVERGLVRVGVEDPRGYATDVHRTVDDRPYGGGPGMLLAVEPLATAVEAARRRLPAGCPVIYLSAQGRPFTQARARSLAAGPGLLLLAGRYEGVDERLLEELVDEELSIGDYVLSGGELAACVVVDACVRLLPGVLVNERSAVEESFGDGLLDWPHYTRPETWRGRAVPEVLRGGNHAAIARWRRQQALGRTADRRPDLLERLTLDDLDARLLREYRAARAAPAGAAAGTAEGQAPEDNSGDPKRSPAD